MKSDSRYLLNESPITCYPTLALALGSDKALIVQQVRYWMEHNSKDPSKRKSHFIDGRWWTYNTFDQWEEAFIWLSLRTIKSMFASLKKEGILLHGFFHHDPRNRTSWYSIDFEQLDQIVEVAVEKYRKKRGESIDSSSLCNSCTLQSDNVASCNGAILHDVIYTETTSRDFFPVNQSNNQSVNQALNAETFSAARENKSDVLDDLKQLHHGSGNSSSVAQQSDRSHLPQSQSNQTDRSHSSGVGESEKKNTVSPRNSLKKEKSVGFKQDEWGIVQLPRAPKYRLASLLATRTMQFLIARDYIECEFAIDRDGDVWILDPKDGDWATEQEVFAGYKDEDGEKVQPTLPLKKLISLVNGSSDEYGPLDIEWYNSTIKQWFMFWKSECERLGDEMVSVVQRKSIGVWMQKALDLEFYEYEEVA